MSAGVNGSSSSTSHRHSGGLPPFGVFSPPPSMDYDEFLEELQNYRRNPPFFYTALLVAQCAVLVAAFLLSVGRIALFARVRTLHINIRILLVNESIGVQLFCCIRFYWTLKQIITQKWDVTALDYLAMVFMYFSTWSSATILFERLHSTVKAKSYEHRYSTTCSVIWALMPWVLSGIFFVISEIIKFDFVIPIWLTHMIVTAVYAAGFLVLLIINHHKGKSKHKTELSEKFQILENIKMIKMMVASSAFTVVANVIQGVLMYYLLFHAYLKNAQADLITSVIVDLFTALRCAIDPVIMFVATRNVLWRSRVRPSAYVVDESQVYFEMLQKQWS